MRRVLRIVIGLAAVAVVGVGVMQSSGAQITPPPTLPPFTTPTFPLPPTLPPFTTTPPPTMPPSTTTPPPTMPPSTTTPPPTMPPSTISTGSADQLIENIIDQLEGFGDQFSNVIDELRALQARF